MSNQPLYLMNCSSYFVSASINDSNNFPIRLKPNTTENLTIPWFTKALWGAQSPSSGVLANASNIFVAKFSEQENGASVVDKVYMALATPGYNGSQGPMPTTGSLCMWIYTNFLLFSQQGKAQLQGFGSLPPAPGWRALPLT